MLVGLLILAGVIVLAVALALYGRHLATAQVRPLHTVTELVGRTVSGKVAAMYLIEQPHRAIVRVYYVTEGDYAVGESWHVEQLRSPTKFPKMRTAHVDDRSFASDRLTRLGLPPTGFVGMRMSDVASGPLTPHVRRRYGPAQELVSFFYEGAEIVGKEVSLTFSDGGELFVNAAE